MNPLTQVKNTQKITAREAALGISDAGSWHAKYKDSAYVYAGNFSFELTEGDLLAIFAQYGEIVDLNLVRDKGTGKSRGFAFLAYEDQRSTVLAVDNLNGASVVGRTIKVDHVAKYKKKEEEDEEEQQRKREERGVCRAFQRGECNRGSACKFSHDEKRSANTGWGPKDDARWGHDRYEAGSRQAYRSREEDGSKRENRSKVREYDKTRGEDRLQDREQTDIMSRSRDEKETTASDRKRQDVIQSNVDRDNRHGGADDRRGRDDNRRERESDHPSKEATDRKDNRERDYRSRDLDKKKYGTPHLRDDNEHSSVDAKESQQSKKLRRLTTDDEDFDEYHTTSHSRRSHSDKDRRHHARDRQIESASKRERS